MERPLKEEATEKPTLPQRMFEEQQERLQFLKERTELLELRKLKVKLEENEAETKRLREDAEKDKKKLRADFEQEKVMLAVEMRRTIREALDLEREKNKREKQEEEQSWYEGWEYGWPTHGQVEEAEGEYEENGEYEEDEEEEVQAFVVATHEAGTEKKKERSEGLGATDQQRSEKPATSSKGSEEKFEAEKEKDRAATRDELMIEVLQMLRSERSERLSGNPKREKEEESEEKGKAETVNSRNFR